MNKFDQHIKDKLSQNQVPPLDAWKNIEEKLDKKENKNKLIPIIYWVGSTAACVILGFGIYFAAQDNKTPKNHEIVNKNTKQKSSSNDSVLIQKINKESKNNHQIEQYFVKQNGSVNKTNISHNLSFNQIISSANSHQNLENNLTDNTQNSNPSIFPKTETENSNLPKQLPVIKKDDIDEKSFELAVENQQKKKEEKIDIKKSSPKIAISSFISPSKMMETKSILSDEFNGNDLKNTVTMAYGAKVAVKINDRLNVRSGISKIDLEQRTNNVTVNIPIETISLSMATNTQYHTNNIAYSSNIMISGKRQNINYFNTLKAEEANIEQKVQYLEVPLEVEYKLFNLDKFNVSAVAGGSYYLLTKNSISMNSTNGKSSQKIGEATNLNTNSYSANAGVKFEYKLSNKTSINLEPNYRYMINPISNVNAKNPSLLGLNLGFSIKF